MTILARSPLQFAVVREDPRVERALIEELRPGRILLIGSGGCTALALRAWFPELDIVLLDPNPAQLAHVERKRAALASFDPRRFNIGSDAEDGLHESGNFERLFRHFRGFLDRFVVPGEERARRLAEPESGWADVVAHPYWPVAFDVAFADPLLRVMFGPMAVQHAEPGSYPAWFRGRIEDGLSAEDRSVNPWLAHVVLGCYREDPAAWPPYLREQPTDRRPFECLGTGLLELPSFASFDLVQLSNVPDWMDDGDCALLARRLAADMAPGGAVLWRQLNDPRPLPRLFEPEFAFDPDRDAALTGIERSLFYDRVHAGVRR